MQNNITMDEDSMIWPQNADEIYQFHYWYLSIFILQRPGKESLNSSTINNTKFNENFDMFYKHVVALQKKLYEIK